MNHSLPPSTPPNSQAPPKRRLRNLLLDARFQLKYTGMVVGVTVVVAAVLGYFAFKYSQGQTEALEACNPGMCDPSAGTSTLNPLAAEFICKSAEAQDSEVLTTILAGIFLLTFAIACTGIVVTHRLVGPAYKLKRMFGLVATGRFKVQGKLRRGDELQDVFDAFASMVDALRKRQMADLEELDHAIAQARASGASDAMLAELLIVRQKLGAARDDNTVRL